METDGRLDDRKVKILKAVIQNYLDTGEPVGSRTISKLTDLQLSSATIRNEMADLEELGYIVQPLNKNKKYGKTNLRLAAFGGIMSFRTSYGAAERPFPRGRQRGGNIRVYRPWLGRLRQWI